MNIVGKRYRYFALSLAIIIPGMIALALWGLPLAIDFTGGSLLVVQFEPGHVPEPGQVLELYQEQGIQDPLVQSAGETNILARSKTIDEAAKGELVAQMESRFGGTVTVLRFETVGPAVGQEVAQRAAGAVAWPPSASSPTSPMPSAVCPTLSATGRRPSSPCCTTCWWSLASRPSWATSWVGRWTPCS